MPDTDPAMDIPPLPPDPPSDWPIIPEENWPPVEIELELLTETAPALPPVPLPPPIAKLTVPPPEIPAAVEKAPLPPPPPIDCAKIPGLFPRLLLDDPFAVICP